MLISEDDMLGNMDSHKITIAVIGSEGGLGRLICAALTGDYLVRRVDINCPNEENTFRADVRSQEDMEQAVEGADVVIHLAAFHGGYAPPPTDETRFDVNVVGTFRLLQACLKKGIGKVIWASSTGAASKIGIYPITKVLGEDLCEYYHLTHGMNIAMMRYGAFTPCDLLTYGERILGVGVDARDCVGATISALDRLLAGQKLFGHFTVMPDHKVLEENRKSFGHQYSAILGAINPYWLDLVSKYRITIPTDLFQHDLTSTQTLLGYQPLYSFGSFFEELQGQDRIGRITPDTPRWCFEQGCRPPEGIIWPECFSFLRIEKV